MFKVFCYCPVNGSDEFYKCEYTGNKYATYDEAKPELLEAREDPDTSLVWIEEVE